VFQNIHLHGKDEKGAAPTPGLITLITAYAETKRNDIERGADSPRLAALMLLLYGRGVIEAAGLLLAGRPAGEKSAIEPIWKVVEAEASALDPQWREEYQLRLKARPADLFYVESAPPESAAAEALMVEDKIGEQDA
jgi:hypothetical protein